MKMEKDRNMADTIRIVMIPQSRRWQDRCHPTRDGATSVNRNDNSSTLVIHHTNHLVFVETLDVCEGIKEIGF